MRPPHLHCARGMEGFSHQRRVPRRPGEANPGDPGPSPPCAPTTACGNQIRDGGSDQQPMINGALEGEVFYDRPGVAVVSWDQESRAVYIDWRSWADPDEFELLVSGGNPAPAPHHRARCVADRPGMRGRQPPAQAMIA